MMRGNGMADSSRAKDRGRMRHIAYGHWHADPTQLRTDVYYLLQPKS
jgi:hypothetical protein